MSTLREVSLAEIESLAIGAWILGTGGGGSPYLALLNMRRLYRDGVRVSLMDATDLADDEVQVGLQQNRVTTVGRALSGIGSAAGYCGLGLLLYEGALPLVGRRGVHPPAVA